MIVLVRPGVFPLVEHKILLTPISEKNKDLPFEIFLIFVRQISTIVGSVRTLLAVFYFASAHHVQIQSGFYGWLLCTATTTGDCRSIPRYISGCWSLFGNLPQQRSLLWRRRFQKCGQVAASNATCATPSSCCNKIFITQRFFGKQQPYGRCYEHAALLLLSLYSRTM